VRNVYKVNETITGYDLAELLHGESGIFEATAPGGEKFQIVCRAEQSISNIRLLPETKAGTTLWRARKIGELRSEQETA
jgi:hypothetical protein